MFEYTMDPTHWTSEANKDDRTSDVIRGLGGPSAKVTVNTTCEVGGARIEKVRETKDG